MKKPHKGALERRAGLQLELRANGDGARKIVGYAAVFNSPSELLPWKERIMPGAFDAHLRTNPDVRALVEHSPSRILGRTKSGTLALRVDSRGLFAEISPPNTTIASDVVESIERGDVDGWSIGFRTKSDEWHLEGGEEMRDLKEIEVFDVTVTSFPLYPETDAALRSLEGFRASQAAVATDLRRRHQQLAELELNIRGDLDLG